MDFWNWKSRYVTLVTIKWMNVGLVLWWTSKTFRELVFIFKCNNEIKLEMVWFISNEFYDLWTLIWWKTCTFFQKSISSWEKTWFILKFCKYVLINELYKNKIFNGKSCLESMHYCYLVQKTFWGSKKIQRKWIFKFINSCHFWSTLPCIYPNYIFKILL
jgi:hypothetical protein